MKISNRIALLGSAITAATFLAAAPAQAACVVTPAATPVAGTVVCGTTTTTDTTYAGVSPSVSRNYNVDTSTGAFTGSVTPSTAIVDGYGLAFTNTVGGANALNVINDGTIQINTGNTATLTGSDDALSITAIGATSVNYSGAGSIINNGAAVGGAGLEISSSGTGDLTATVGGNVSTLGNEYAVRLNQNGTDGNVVVSTATGTTLRGGFGGVAGFVNNAASDGTVSVTNNAAVGSRTTALNTFVFGVVGQSAGIGAVTVVNNGAVGLATDRALQEGVYGRITNAVSTAPLSVSGSGAVFSAGTGVNAINLGLGTTTVNYTGAVNSTGALGINVSTAATTAATSVTTGAGAVSATGVGGVGINVSGVAAPATVTTGAGAVTGTDYGIQVATTGVQTINANGVTTGAIAGIHSNTTALRTINVGAAGNVTGTTQSILLANTGGAAVNNSGIIGGAAATGLAINAATATAPVVVTNAASGVLNGRLTLGAGADSLVNGGTFNTQATTDFGAGVDVLNNQTAGIINILGATTFANLETFTQNGRINLGANTLTLSGTPFVNAGTIDTSGNASILGITSFSNTGTLDLAAGTFTVPLVAFTNSGTILADEGVSSISGQSSFANSGTIDLQDGAIGDVLTINSNYAGSGASNLLVDFSDTAADRLVINGAASGTTRVNANFVGAGLINVGGVLVVDTTTTAANAFTLGTVGGNTSPLIDYRLVQNGQDFFLTSAPNASAFDPLAVSNMAGSLWYQSADEVIAQTDLPSAAAGTGFWGQVYYSQDKFGDNNDVAVIDGTSFDVNNRLKTKRLGIQAGVDYGFGGARIGLTGGYGRAKADNDLNSQLKAKGWNLGVYGQFGGTIGFHGSFLAKHDRYKLNFESGAFNGEKADLRANGVDGSLGYRFGLGEDATLDAKVGLAHVRTKIDDISAFGFSYDIDRVTSTRGRAGLRATFGGNLAPYVDATVYREFNGNGNVRLFDGATSYDIDSRGKGTWARLEAGLAAVSGSGPILAAWADLGDKKGFGVRAGFRFGGRAVEEILPPPVAAPPPPPPPPATQTCYDGSVILATDICPSPPPPPPPPPPAPEPERG